MSTVFVLLFLTALICLAIGLFRPSFLSRFFRGIEPSRKKVGLIFGTSAFVFMLLTGITGGNTSNNAPAQQSTAPAPTASPTIAQASPTPTPATPDPVVLNVSQLVGKDINGVIGTLGKANVDSSQPTKEQLALGATEWWNEWKVKDVDLLVTYNPNTGQIIDFFISANQENTTTNQDKLLLITGTSRSASTYSVTFVTANTDRSKMTGMKITPK